MMDDERERHEDRCPNCGRFVEAEADGFYDLLEPDNEVSHHAVFCDEPCSDTYRAKYKEGRKK